MPEPELDPALLARLVRIGGRPLLEQLIDTFAGDAAGRRQALTAALAARDAEGVAAAAHAIIAGAGQLGATALSNEARDLEQAARAGDLDAVAGRLPAFLDRFSRVLAALAAAREAR